MKMTTAIVSNERKCDLCGKPLLEDETFYDFVPGIALGGGPTAWAWGCYQCFIAFEGELGMGKGQEYDSKTKKKLRG